LNTSSGTDGFHFDSSCDPADEVIPPGLMKFIVADPTQVLDIYSELTGQPRIELGPRRGSKITLRSQTPLTRREAAWLLETALLLNGIPVPPKTTDLISNRPYWRNLRVE